MAKRRIQDDVKLPRDDHPVRKSGGDDRPVMFHKAGSGNLIGIRPGRVMRFDGGVFDGSRCTWIDLDLVDRSWCVAVQEDVQTVADKLGCE